MGCRAMHGWPGPLIKAPRKAAAARKLVFDFMCLLVAQQAIHAAAEADLTKNLIRICFSRAAIYLNSM